MTTSTALAPIRVDDWRNRVLCMDAITFLRSLPANSVHCIVTSPPYYGLRDYGADGQIGLEDTPEAYTARLVELFRLARRVLRDDGVLWLNLGDSYNGSGKKDIQINSPKQMTNGGATSQRGTNWDRLKPKDLIGIPWRVAFALQADGWWLRSDIIWHKPNPMPESVTDRCTVAHEYVFMLTKSARYWYDADAVREAHKPESLKRYEYGLQSRAPADGFISAGAANKRSITHCDRMGDNINAAGRNRRTVWTVPTEPKPFSHFAMFPQALIEPMILAGCPDTVCSACGAGYVRQVERTANYTQRRDRGQPNGQGAQVDSSGWQPATVHDHGFAPSCDCNAPTSPGIVIDPFMGSGTTALVAQRLGRDFIGCDLNPEYVALANKRIQYRGDDRRMVKEQNAGVEQLELFA